MNNIIRHFFRLSGSVTAKDLYWMFSGNLFSILFAFIFTIIIARFITPNEYGIFLTLFSWSTLVAELSDFGINNSLSIFFPKLKKQNRYSEIKSVYITAFNLELIIGILVMIVSLLTLPLLNRIIFHDVARTLLLITIVETFFIQLTSFAIMTQAAYQKFREFAYVSMFFGFVRLLFLMIFWFFGRITLIDILLIQLGASILNVLFAQIFTKFPVKIAEFDPGKIRNIFRYSGFMGITKIIQGISSRLDFLMLLPIAGAAATGAYGAASRISQIYPFLVTGFGQVIAPKMASYENGREAWPFLKKTLLVVVIFLFTIAVFYVFSEPLVKILFGLSYVQSIPILKGLLLALTGYIMGVPFTTLLVYTYKKPQIMTGMVLIQLLIIFAANFILIPLYGNMGPIYGLGIANALMFILSFGISLFLMKKDHENSH